MYTFPSLLFGGCEYLGPVICRFSIRSDCVVKLARVAPRLRNQRRAKWKNRASLFQREPIDQTRASVSTERAITKSWSGIENSILQNLLGGGVKNKITDGRSEVKRALAFFLLFLLFLSFFLFFRFILSLAVYVRERMFLCLPSERSAEGKRKIERNERSGAPFYSPNRDQESSLPLGSTLARQLINSARVRDAIVGLGLLGEPGEGNERVGTKRQGFDNFSPMTSGDEKLPRNPFSLPPAVTYFLFTTLRLCFHVGPTTANHPFLLRVDHPSIS